MIYQVDTHGTRDLLAAVSRVPIILVVDDEKSMLAMVRDVLEDEGYRVLTACEGYEALKLANRVCPDLIITDLMMPHMNGRKLRQILGNTPKTCDIPIILMTAAYYPEKDDRFAAIIAKPFQLDDFLDDVQRCTPPTSTN